MIKLIATAIIVTSGFAFGVSLSDKEKKKLRTAEELLEFLEYVRWSIERRSLPLGEIFEEYLSKAKESPKEEKKTFIKNLTEARGTLGEKISVLSENLYSENAKRELIHMSQNLGMLDKESQINALHQAKTALEAEISVQRAKYTSKNKLYKAIPLLISCVISLLLY